MVQRFDGFVTIKSYKLDVENIGTLNMAHRNSLMWSIGNLIVLIVVYKASKKSLLAYFHNYFTLNSSIHRFRTCQAIRAGWHQGKARGGYSPSIGTC